MQTMTIGQLAKATGIGIEAIRFYERRGILPCPERKSSGYRLFGPDAVARVQFIRRAQAVGFTLKEIEALLKLRSDPTATKEDVRAQVSEKIDDVDAKIRELRRIRKDLQQLLASCDGQGPVDDCPIVESLSQKECHKELHHGH